MKSRVGPSPRCQGTSQGTSQGGTSQSTYRRARVYKPGICEYKGLRCGPRFTRWPPPEFQVVRPSVQQPYVTQVDVDGRFIVVCGCVCVVYVCVLYVRICVCI